MKPYRQPNNFTPNPRFSTTASGAAPIPQPFNPHTFTRYRAQSQTIEPLFVSRLSRTSARRGRSEERDRVLRTCFEFLNILLVSLSLFLVAGVVTVLGTYKLIENNKRYFVRPCNQVESPIVWPRRDGQFRMATIERTAVYALFVKSDGEEEVVEEVMVMTTRGKSGKTKLAIRNKTATSCKFWGNIGWVNTSWHGLRSVILGTRSTTRKPSSHAPSTTSESEEEKIATTASKSENTKSPTPSKTASRYKYNFGWVNAIWHNFTSGFSEKKKAENETSSKSEEKIGTMQETLTSVLTTKTAKSKWYKWFEPSIVMEIKTVTWTPPTNPTTQRKEFPNGQSTKKEATTTPHPTPSIGIEALVNQYIERERKPDNDYLNHNSPNDLFSRMINVGMQIYLPPIFNIPDYTTLLLAKTSTLTQSLSQLTFHHASQRALQNVFKALENILREDVTYKMRQRDIDASLQLQTLVSGVTRNYELGKSDSGLELQMKMKRGYIKQLKNHYDLAKFYVGMIEDELHRATHFYDAVAKFSGLLDEEKASINIARNPSALEKQEIMRKYQHVIFCLEDLSMHQKTFDAKLQIRLEKLQILLARKEQDFVDSVDYDQWYDAADTGGLWSTKDETNRLSEKILEKFDMDVRHLKALKERIDWNIEVKHDFRGPRAGKEEKKRGFG